MVDCHCLCLWIAVYLLTLQASAGPSWGPDLQISSQPWWKSHKTIPCYKSFSLSLSLSPHTRAYISYCFYFPIGTLPDIDFDTKNCSWGIESYHDFSELILCFLDLFSSVTRLKALMTSFPVTVHGIMWQ